MDSASIRRRFGRGDFNIACYLLELAGFADGSAEQLAYLRHAAESATVHGRGLAQSVRMLLSAVDCCSVALRARVGLVGELTTAGGAMTYTHPSGMVARCGTDEPDFAEVLLDEVQAWDRLDDDQLDVLAEEVTQHARVVLGQA